MNRSQILYEIVVLEQKLSDSECEQEKEYLTEKLRELNALLG